MVNKMLFIDLSHLSVIGFTLLTPLLPQSFFFAIDGLT